MKVLVKQICFYAISLFFALTTLAVLMRIPIFESIGIFYYRTIAKALVACILLAILICLGIYYCKNTKHADWLNLASGCSALLLVGMALALFITLGPLTIDRSYTIYSLADLANNPTKEYTVDEVEQQFYKGYIIEHKSSEKRLNEQVSIGNIEKRGEKYCITEKGISLVNTFRLIEKIFPVEDKWVVNPE